MHPAMFGRFAGSAGVENEASTHKTAVNATVAALVVLTLVRRERIFLVDLFFSESRLFHPKLRL